MHLKIDNIPVSVIDSHWANTPLGVHFIGFLQENAYPWIAALIRDEDNREDNVNTQCSGTLVSFHNLTPRFLFSIRLEAPGWSRQPTASTKMANVLLQSPSLFYLDFTTGAKSQSPTGAVKFLAVHRQPCHLLTDWSLRHLLILEHKEQPQRPLRHLIREMRIHDLSKILVKFEQFFFTTLSFFSFPGSK